MTEPIACPECGDTKWYALEDFHGTDRVDLWTQIGSHNAARVDNDNVSYNVDDFDGWYCDAHDHPAPDDLFEQLTELCDTVR